MFYTVEPPSFLLCGTLVAMPDDHVNDATVWHWQLAVSALFSGVSPFDNISLFVTMSITCINSVIQMTRKIIVAHTPKSHARHVDFGAGNF